MGPLDPRRAFLPFGPTTGARIAIHDRLRRSAREATAGLKLELALARAAGERRGKLCRLHRIRRPNRPRRFTPLSTMPAGQGAAATGLKILAPRTNGNVTSTPIRAGQVEGTGASAGAVARATHPRLLGRRRGRMLERAARREVLAHASVRLRAVRRPGTASGIHHARARAGISVTPNTARSCSSAKPVAQRAVHANARRDLALLPGRFGHGAASTRPRQRTSPTAEAGVLPRRLLRTAARARLAARPARAAQDQKRVPLLPAYEDEGELLIGLSLARRPATA